MPVFSLIRKAANPSAIRTSIAVFSACAVVLAVDAKANALSELAQHAPEPAWSKVCGKVDDQQECHISRKELTAQGRPSVRMTITERDDERLLQIAVPPAAIIQPGIQVKIDTGAPTKVQYVACTPGECLAVGKINLEMIGRLKRGRTLLVTMINPRGKHVGFDISLMGFTAAYDGPAIDESQVGTHQEGQEDDLKRMADAAREELMSQAQKRDTQ